MDLQHNFTVPVDIEVAWVAFTDVERIAPCLPGAEITSVDGADFSGTADVKLGPISMQYHGRGTWVSRDGRQYRAVIEAQGKDRRGNGTARATITADLTSVADGTRVDVQTQLKITGRPAQFGRGVIQDVGAKLLDQFAACLASRLAEQSPADAAAPGDSQVEQAAIAGLARDGTRAPATFVDEPRADSRAGTADVHRIDLAGLAGPVLLRRWGPWVVGAVALVALGWLIGSR